MKRIYVCAQCGETNLEFDAWLRWDIKNQKWIKQLTDEDPWCNDCGDRVKEREIIIFDSIKII